MSGSRSSLIIAYSFNKSDIEGVNNCISPSTPTLHPNAQHPSQSTSRYMIAQVECKIQSSQPHRYRLSVIYNYHDPVASFAFNISDLVHCTMAYSFFSFFQGKTPHNFFVLIHIICYSPNKKTIELYLTFQTFPYNWLE